MDAVQTQLSPERGGAFAGAVSFPALTLALGYLPTRPLVGVAGEGLSMAGTLQRRAEAGQSWPIARAFS